MKRREFVLMVGGVGAASALPALARAQQPAKLPTIGFLGSNTLVTQSQSTLAFVGRLRELGWIEDHSVVIQYWWAEGRTERFAEIASECVRLKVDVIVTAGTKSVVMAKQATLSIPIVFASATDPVGTGLVASLAQPGGNVTGLSVERTDAVSKLFELLHEVVPDFRGLATLVNTGSSGAVQEANAVHFAARAFGLRVIPVEIRSAEDIIPALEAVNGQANALYVVSDPLTFANRDQILTFAQVSQMPSIFLAREYVDAGGLMSYAPNLADQFKRAADLVDKILRGAKPADIAIEQPTKFDVAVNLKTAKALGLTVPRSLLLRADAVVE